MPILRPRTALIGSIVCLAGLVLTGALAYLIPVSHVHDSATLAGFEALNRPRLTPLLSHVAHFADTVPYAVIGLSLALLAALRHRPRVAIAIPMLLFVTGATTELLKLTLAHPRFSEWLGNGQISAASWPSGHATASMTLAFCAVMAAPPRLRPTVAALGAAFAVSVSYAILALGWHFPSDVIGGFFVAAMWTLLTVAVLTRWPGAARERAAEAADMRGPVLIGTAVTGFATLVFLARPHQVTQFALARPSFVIGASAIAALGGALAVGLARGMRS